MSDIEEVKNAVRDYHDDYRNPSLARPRVSDPYYLDKSLRDSVPADQVWPATWPQAGKPGVYVFFDANGNRLYIGKADDLGTRLSSYFRYAKDKNCEPKDDWGKHKPYSLVTVSVSETFEASSLEEFLIDRLKPPINKKGKRA